MSDANGAGATAWVALLRGVNVGGITIRSADLWALFDDLGLDEVRTVLASGNVAFSTGGTAETRAAPSTRIDLKTLIENGLRDRFGYDAWIVLVTRDELAEAVDLFPFDDSAADRQPYVVFCTDDATRDELVDAAASLDHAIDPVAPGAGVVYWNPPKGRTLDTAFAKVIGRRAYKERTTNRNLRTLFKILG